MRPLQILVSALLLVLPLDAADEKPLPFDGKIVSVSTGENGCGVALENVSVVEIAGTRYLRGTAVKTADERYWYRGKEVLIPEKAVTIIVLFKNVEELDEAMIRADKALRAQAGPPGGNPKER